MKGGMKSSNYSEKGASVVPTGRGVRPGMKETRSMPKESPKRTRKQAGNSTYDSKM